MTSSIALGALPSAQVFAAGSDIDGHWAQQQILTFAENGYIAGDGTGNYLPNQIMTRAQFAAVINRVMGYTEESPSIANYTDVEDSAWYRSDLAKALSAGYMSGTSATTMSPNQPVTREQAAVMIVRLLEENTSVDLSVLDDFTDRGDISAFAVNAMAKLISDGYLYGADGKLMPQKSMTRAEGIALLSRSMDALKDINLEEEKEETKTEEKDNSNKGSSGGSSGGGSSSGGGGSSSGGGGSSSGGGGSSKPSQNIAKAAQTKLVDLGRSQYVVVSFEEGFSKDNTKLIIDGVNVTSNFTNVDDDGTIVKWELTSLKPAKLVLESGNSKQEVKLTDNQNPKEPEVLASVPESYNLMANGAVAVWDYHLTNYDEAGVVRVYPKKTTFDLDASDESIPYYSPDAEVTEEGTGEVTGEVIVMFNYSTAEEKQWFDGITDVDLVAFNENNNTLNDKLQYTKGQAEHHGKTVGQISISLGQTNFRNNGRYNIRVTSGGQSWLFPIHVVNEKAPSMHLQWDGGVIQSGENVRFHVEDMVYGITMPVYRVTLTAPDGKIKELEKFTDYYLIGELFVLYNDVEGHNNIPDNGTYTIKVYAEGFKPMETTFVVGSGVNNAITYAGADAVTMATFDGGGGSNVMNAYLIFDSDLLANAEILTELGIEQESAAKIAERWDQDMTSWLYVFDKGGKVFYDYSGKSGAFTNMVDKAEADGEYLTFAEFQKEGTASVTQNRPYAAKYVLEDNLLGETQMGGSYIGRPAPELTVVESQEGSDLKLSCADTTYLAAIAEDGEIYLNGDLYPLAQDDFTVKLKDATLTIVKDKLKVGENTIRISVGGYQDKKIEVDYGKTVEETVLEVKAGNIGEAVTVTAAGENATGDIWKYLTEVKLTYPDNTEKKVLPDGDESVYKEIGYEISGKDLILGKDLFTQAGKYQIAVTAKYYGTKTVEFTVVDGTSTETKPLPEYKGVTCEKSAFYEVTYTFTFTPSYDKNIEAWIGAVNKVTVNGTEYSSGVGDPYFTTNTTDQKIILHGDKPFKDGDNTVVISAEDYKDLTLTVGKDGTIGGDAGEDPGEPGENQDAPAVKSLDFVEPSYMSNGYYRLKFNLTEDDASAYLEAITSMKINEVECNKKETSFSGNTNSYKFSNDEAYGGDDQFIDFTEDCFSGEGEHTLTISADDYETLTYTYPAQ